MAYFLITYDLNKNQDYQRLIDEIDKFDTGKAALSAYFLAANNSAIEIKNHFTKFVDSDDILIVVEFSKRPQAALMYQEGIDWVESHFG